MRYGDHHPIRADRIGHPSGSTTNRPDEAKKLVTNYVISDEMAERIANRSSPSSQFDESVDHKGVLIVGNYGTGKSHLMSVISLVAEDATYRPTISPPEESSKRPAQIAGKFKVHRIEISSQMVAARHRHAAAGAFLEKHGRQLSVPAADKVSQDKAAFEGDDGRVRRELPRPRRAARRRRVPGVPALAARTTTWSWICRSCARSARSTKHLRFRFVAGVQEAIFDSTRFQHVADSLRRVKDRFTQVLLARQDVSFVVAERLLKKTADQQNRIRDLPHAVRQVLRPHERAHGRVRAPVPRPSGLHRRLRAADASPRSAARCDAVAARCRPCSTRTFPKIGLA